MTGLADVGRFKICIQALLAFIALSAAQSSAQTRIHSAILIIDTSNNASYNQVHWLVRTPYLSIKASNDCVSLGFQPLVTARKRSLGQGNIFTPVCHSVHRGGLPQCMLGYHHPPGPGAHTPPEQSMLGDTVNARAVRILLECYLVLGVNEWVLYHAHY